MCVGDSRLPSLALCIREAVSVWKSLMIPFLFLHVVSFRNAAHVLVELDLRLPSFSSGFHVFVFLRCFLEGFSPLYTCMEIFTFLIFKTSVLSSERSAFTPPCSCFVNGTPSLGSLRILQLLNSFQVFFSPHTASVPGSLFPLVCWWFLFPVRVCPQVAGGPWLPGCF